MLLKSIGLLTSGLVLAIVMLLAVKIIMNRLALIQFKKLSRGLPICPEAGLLSNHIVSFALGKNNCNKLLEWHKNFGETIGWLNGPNFCASTIDLDFIKKFIYDEPNTHMNRPKLNLPVREITESIFFNDKKEWRNVRKAVAPAFTASKFKTPNVQAEIQDTIDKVIGFIELKLSKLEPGQQVDIDEVAQRYSASLVARCFYKQDNLINFHRPDDLWIKTFDASMRAIQDNVIFKIAMIFPMSAKLIDWLMWHFTPVGLARRKFLHYVKLQTKLGIEARKQLDEMKQSGTDQVTDADNFVMKDGTQFKRNMIDHFIDQFIDGKITKDQYLYTSIFLLAAANRTSSDGIVHTIYQLSIHQNVQDKLRQAIEADGIETDYLDWVLKESLRVMPTAPLACTRVMAHDMEIKGGYRVPAGTYVLTCAYVIHRLKEYWGEDADEFKPERWRDTSHHHPCQYLPFGAGPRGCPGQMFAMHEMKMLFASLLTRYKFEGQVSDEAYNFSSPYFIFLIPESVTKVTITKLE